MPQRHQELVSGCILLLLAQAPSHGYGMHERVSELMPLWDVSTGNLYRELRRMHTEGLVISVWEASQVRGPARRVYEITEAGRLALDRWVLGVAGLIGMLDECLSAHGSLPAPPRRRPENTP